MELRQLKYFLSVLEHGGFNRAANACHVTQPALSKSMKALEDELGVELLDRSGGTVAATPYGKVLARAAHRADGELKRAIKEINSMADRGGGKLVVGGGVVLRYLLPSTRELIRRESPQLELVVLEAGVAVSLLAALARGEVDVAICAPATDDLAPGICHEHLFRDRITVVAHHTHPLAGQSSLRVSDLQPYAWAIPGEQERERQVLERCLYNAGLPPPRIAVETSSSALMAQLLQREPLLSYLPGILLEQDPALGELRAVPVDIPWRERELHLYWREASTTLPAVDSFLRCVREVAHQLRVQGEAPARPPVLRRVAP